MPPKEYAALAKISRILKFRKQRRHMVPDISLQLPFMSNMAGLSFRLLFSAENLSGSK